MQITKDQIINALKTVNDPDLKKDLISLNMISDIEINNKSIFFKLILTTPACPLKNKIKQDCIEAIHNFIDNKLDINIELTSQTTTQNKNETTFLSNIKNIIAIASGKGGVGKSTVAANIAIELAKSGAKVGLIDADIYGPSVPLMFAEQNAKPLAIDKNGKSVAIPIEKYGVKLMSIGFFIDHKKALIWRGPMAANALMQLFTDVDWGELDYMIIDLPPGTGDIQLTLVQKLPFAYCAIVTTPQNIALADVRKSIEMFNNEAVNIQMLGVIENMSWFTPEELPNNKYYIFGKGGGAILAKEFNIMLLGQIPIIQSICQSGDNGEPVSIARNDALKEYFKNITENITRQVSLFNDKNFNNKQIN